jgi:hypothetical protein
MSKRTRTKRPTTATPRKVGTSRYLYVSAPLVDITDQSGAPTGKVRVGSAPPYRKPR